MPLTVHLALDFRPYRWSDPAERSLWLFIQPVVENPQLQAEWIRSCAAAVPNTDVALEILTPQTCKPGAEYVAVGIETWRNLTVRLDTSTNPLEVGNTSPAQAVVITDAKRFSAANRDLEATDVSKASNLRRQVESDQGAFTLSGAAESFRAIYNRYALQAIEDASLKQRPRVLQMLDMNLRIGKRFLLAPEFARLSPDFAAFRMPDVGEPQDTNRLPLQSLLGLVVRLASPADLANPAKRALLKTVNGIGICFESGGPVVCRANSADAQTALSTLFGSIEAFQDERRVMGRWARSFENEVRVDRAFEFCGPEDAGNAGGALFPLSTLLSVTDIDELKILPTEQAPDGGTAAPAASLAASPVLVASGSFVPLGAPLATAPVFCFKFETTAALQAALKSLGDVAMRKLTARASFTSAAWSVERVAWDAQSGHFLVLASKSGSQADLSATGLRATLDATWDDGVFRLDAKGFGAELFGERFHFRRAIRDQSTEVGAPPAASSPEALFNGLRIKLPGDERWKTGILAYSAKRTLTFLLVQQAGRVGGALVAVYPVDPSQACVPATTLTESMRHDLPNYKSLKVFRGSTGGNRRAIARFDKITPDLWFAKAAAEYSNVFDLVVQDYQEELGKAVQAFGASNADAANLTLALDARIKRHFDDASRAAPVSFELEHTLGERIAVSSASGTFQVGNCLGEVIALPTDVSPGGPVQVASKGATTVTQAPRPFLYFSHVADDAKKTEEIVVHLQLSLLDYTKFTAWLLASTRAADPKMTPAEARKAVDAGAPGLYARFLTSLYELVNADAVTVKAWFAGYDAAIEPPADARNLGPIRERLLNLRDPWEPAKQIGTWIVAEIRKSLPPSGLRQDITYPSVSLANALAPADKARGTCLALAFLLEVVRRPQKAPDVDVAKYAFCSNRLSLPPAARKDARLAYGEEGRLIDALDPSSYLMPFKDWLAPRTRRTAWIPVMRPARNAEGTSEESLFESAFGAPDEARPDTGPAAAFMVRTGATLKSERNGDLAAIACPVSFLPVAIDPALGASTHEILERYFALLARALGDETVVLGEAGTPEARLNTAVCRRERLAAIAREAAALLVSDATPTMDPANDTVPKEVRALAQSLMAAGAARASMAEWLEKQLVADPSKLFGTKAVLATSIAGSAGVPHIPSWFVAVGQVHECEPRVAGTPSGQVAVIHRREEARYVSLPPAAATRRAQSLVFAQLLDDERYGNAFAIARSKALSIGKFVDHRAEISAGKERTGLKIESFDVAIQSVALPAPTSSAAAKVQLPSRYPVAPPVIHDAFVARREIAWKLGNVFSYSDLTRGPQGTQAWPAPYGATETLAARTIGVSAAVSKPAPLDAVEVTLVASLIGDEEMNDPTAARLPGDAIVNDSLSFVPAASFTPQPQSAALPVTSTTTPAVRCSTNPAADLSDWSLFSGATRGALSGMDVDRMIDFWPRVAGMMRRHPTMSPEISQAIASGQRRVRFSRSQDPNRVEVELTNFEGARLALFEVKAKAQGQEPAKTIRFAFALQVRQPVWRMFRPGIVHSRNVDTSARFDPRFGSASAAITDDDPMRLTKVVAAGEHQWRLQAPGPIGSRWKLTSFVEALRAKKGTGGAQRVISDEILQTGEWKNFELSVTVYLVAEPRLPNASDQQLRGGTSLTRSYFPLRNARYRPADRAQEAAVDLFPELANGVTRFRIDLAWFDDKRVEFYRVEDIVIDLK